MAKRTQMIARFGLVSIMVLFATPTFAQKPQINHEDRLNLVRLYNDTAKQTVENFLTGRGQTNATETFVSTVLKFDLNRLTSDEQAYRAKFLEKRWNALQESKKQVFKVPSPPQQATLEPKKNPHRFGRLNIDLEASTLESMLNAQPLQMEDNVNISYSFPFMPDIPTFTFKAANYLEEIRVNLQVPSTVPNELYPEIKAVLAASLQLNQLSESNTDNWITITAMPPPPPPNQKSFAQSWLQVILSPQNATLGILIACLVLGFFLIIATLLMARVFSRVASGIASLAPEKETTTSSDSSQELPAEHTNTTAETAIAPDRREDSKYDQQASTNALTTEMKNIRDQFVELLAGNESLIAELIRDIFYEENGLSAIRDTISFLGYKAMREILGKLPQEAMSRLQTFMDENRDDPISLLNGVDTTQRIYRDAVMRLSMAKDNEQLERFRDFLVKTDDTTLIQALPAFNAQQVALVIKTLTVERCNTMVKSIPVETLKQAAQILDKEFPDALQLVNETINSLEVLSENQPVTSNEQMQFVIRLAKSAEIEEEDNVLAMVGPEDWQIARRIMETKFFFSQLSLLPTDFLRATIDKVETNIRAEFLLICSEEMRTELLATYSGKLKELLDNEVQLITSNKRRQKDIEKRRIQIAQRLMKLVREQTKTSPQVILQALQKRAQVEGVPLPTSWQTDVVEDTQNDDQALGDAA